MEKKNTFSVLAEDIQNDMLPEIRKNAQKDLLKKKVDYLVHGHTHYPGEYDKVIDCGSFVVGVSYVVISGGQPKLEKVLFW